MNLLTAGMSCVSDTQRGQKTVIPWELGTLGWVLGALVWVLGIEPGFSEKQQVLLTTEPSLSPCRTEFLLLPVKIIGYPIGLRQLDPRQLKSARRGPAPRASHYFCLALLLY